MYRFGEDLVHSAVDSSFDICFFSMSGDRSNNRLWKVVSEQVLSYFRGSLVPVHERHVAIHQDQLEASAISDALFYFLESLLPVVSD